MERFEVVLVGGRRAPYTSWTFIEVPATVAASLGHGPVRGTLAGTPFRGTASRSNGVLRVPVVRELLVRAGVGRGDRVEVSLERDPQPRTVEVPAELRARLGKDAGLAAAFDALAPSLRRAWAEYVGSAKRPETRERRAASAPDGIRTRTYPP